MNFVNNMKLNISDIYFATNLLNRLKETEKQTNKQDLKIVPIQIQAPKKVHKQPQTVVQKITNIPTVASQYLPVESELEIDLETSKRMIFGLYIFFI